MPVIWNLRKWLAVEHNIYRPSELQLLLAQKAGVRLSLQSISTLMKEKPSALRLQTIQAICNALNCRLSDFCDVVQDTAKDQELKKVVGLEPARLYGTKSRPEGGEESFPSPRDYLKRKK